MEQTPNAPEILYVYECSAKHRIFRRDDVNTAGCSRCFGRPFRRIGAVQRNDGESETQHHIRALSLKEQRVN